MDPRWKTSKGRRRGRPGDTYGESALTLDATAMSVCRLALFTALDTRESRPFGPGTSALFGGTVLASHARDRSVHRDRAGSAWCSQPELGLETLTNSLYVMRPAPVAARATSVFACGGKSR